MQTLAPLIIRSITRRSRRSLLTIGGVAISICVLALLLASYEALFLSPPNPVQALRLITRHRVSMTQPLPLSYGAKIREVPGVTAVSAWTWFQGQYKDAANPANTFGRFAVEPEHMLRVKADLQMPLDQKEAFRTNRTAAIASDLLAKRHGWKIGDRIPLTGDIFPVSLELTLLGIYRDVDEDEALFFSHEYLKEALGGDRLANTTGMFYIQAADQSKMGSIARGVDALFDNSPYPTRSETEREFQLSFVSFIGNLKVFLTALFGAVAFTILLVAGNTAAMSVRERVREVGVLKTIGYSNGQILGLVIGEISTVCLLGGLLGLLLCTLLTGAIRQAPSGIYELKTMVVAPWIWAASLAVALLIGVISSAIPARKASTLPIVDSLRAVG